MIQVEFIEDLPDDLITPPRALMILMIYKQVIRNRILKAGFALKVIISKPV